MSGTIVRWVARVAASVAVCSTVSLASVLAVGMLSDDDSDEDRSDRSEAGVDAGVPMDD